jgi:hypothetical protein
VFFFDPEWYAAQFGGKTALAQSGLSPEEHYHTLGAAMGLSPNRYFDEGWYARTYSHAIRQGSYVSGFHHYMVRGAPECFNPNASFDEKWYLAQYPDVASAVKAGALRCGYEHYLLSGQLERRKGSPDDAPERTSAATYTPVVTTSPHVDKLHVVIRPRLASSPRLNVVLPSLQMRHMSGGPNTILNLAYRLANEGLPLRLVSCNTTLDAGCEPLWQHLQSLSGVSQALSNVEIADASNPHNPASIGENDIFVASAWWTAQMIADVLPLMRKQKYWYVIQDFEPGLHAWSSAYAMALETYSHDILPIFNTSLLRDYFVQNRIGRFADPGLVAAALFFEPATDRRFFAPEPRMDKRPRRLLFYSRPIAAARNLFEIGLAALEIAASQGAFDSDRWEIRYVGDTLPETKLSGNHLIRPVPWLSYDSYARLMRQSDILLSLMLSPHPSYPPLEMAACGGIVVTNTFDCKTSARLADYSPNILAPEPFRGAIANALGRAVIRAQKDMPRVSSASILPADWSESFARVIPALVGTWRQEHGTAAAAGVS